jgi:beta-ketodecanoyl-[acyl-carrier-protein] synthase
MFYQQGKKVFKEVIPFVENFVTQQLATQKIPLTQLKRLWLHQANGNMNRLIATKILGHEPSFSEAPIILDEYANTASAGSIIAFHKHHQDLKTGDIGLICSFGAGYSVGSVLVKKL